jgi:hypothetical protein
MKSLIFIKNYSEKTILVFANMIDTPNDATMIKAKIHEHFPNLAFTYLRRTKLLKNALESGMSASELYESSKHSQHLYRQAYAEYHKILKLFTTEGQYFQAQNS